MTAEICAKDAPASRLALGFISNATEPQIRIGRSGFTAFVQNRRFDSTQIRVTEVIPKDAIASPFAFDQFGVTST